MKIDRVTLIIQINKFADKLAKDNNFYQYWCEAIANALVEGKEIFENIDNFEPTIEWVEKTYVALKKLEFITEKIKDNNEK